MAASKNIIHVSEADFEYEVIAYSQQIPVIVDFWAEWCAPCRMLGPLLEKLVVESEGKYRLAKVDVDSNPALVMRFDVRSIPAIKAFKDGQVVAELTGMQTEARLREFLNKLAPSQGSLSLEKALGLLQMQKPEKAEQAFRDVLAKSPDHSAALLGLSKSLLLQGQAGEASFLLRRFPASREYASAEILRPMAEALDWLDRVETTGEFAGSGEPQDSLEPAYRNALRLVKRGNLLAAMDGLLDILRQDKRYRNGEARQVMLGLLELLGEEHPETRQYRNELAAVLF